VTALDMDAASELGRSNRLYDRGHCVLACWFEVSMNGKHQIILQLQYFRLCKSTVSTI